jgi:hypothetical protein
LILSNGVSAQHNPHHKKRELVNLDKFDDKLIHFGFSLGLNRAGFNMNTDLSRSDSNTRGIEMRPQMGFNLGIVSDLHLGTLFNLRFIPTLSFCQRNLVYRSLDINGDKSFYTKPVESTYLDFPLNLKFRSYRDKNFAAYLVGGFMYSYDLVSKEKTDNSSYNPDDIVIKLNRHTYSYQVGLGLDLFLQYFKFSPEIKWSFGLNNNLIQDNTLFAKPIDVLKSRIFLVSLTFEG